MNELSEAAREVAIAYSGFGRVLLFCLIGGGALGLLIALLRKGRRR